MEKLNDSDILFITTSRYTPWLEWCQKSVKKFFPNSEHLIIDGTQNWPNIWFEWIYRLPNYSAKYFIMIDEDCFLLQREGVLEAVAKLITQNATLAGVHDCYFTWRGFNEVALNPFFMIGDRVKLLNVITSIPHYRTLRFNQKYFQTANYEWPIKDRQRIAYEYEPFYCLYWAVLEASQKLLYLYPADDYGFSNQDNKLPATCVRVTPDSPNIALHMWYSRQWNDHQNAVRYEKLLKYLPTILS